MSVSVTFGASDVPGLLAAAGFTFFGVWLLWLDPGRRLHQAFFLYAFLRAGFLVCARIGDDVFSLGFRLSGYFAMAAPFAAAYFALVYRDTFHGAPRPRVNARTAAPYLLGGAVVFEGIYLADHQLYISGWLTLLSDGIFLTAALLAFFLAREAVRPSASATCRGALLAASIGFLIEPAYQATWQIAESTTEIVMGSPDRGQYVVPLVIGMQLVYLATLLLVAATLRVLARLPERTRASRALGVTAVGVATGVAVPLAILFALSLMVRDRAGIDVWIAAHRIADGVALFAGVCLLAYAGLRQGLFNIQWKLRIAIKGSTLAGIFLAILFVVSEGTQILFQALAQRDGAGPLRSASALVGVVGAGLVVFFLHPVQRFAERIAAGTVPHAKPVTEMSHPERISLYREQAELAWLDGNLQRKERLLLDGLRVRLGLSLEESAAVETAALASTERLVMPGLVNASVASPPRRPKRPSASSRARKV